MTYPPEPFKRIAAVPFNNRTVVATYITPTGETLRRFEHLERSKYAPRRNTPKAER